MFDEEDENSDINSIEEADKHIAELWRRIRALERRVLMLERAAKE